MLTLLQVFLAGLATGCIYGLIALSFVLIYKATQTISFMQGELLMLSSFVALSLSVAGAWPWWLALLTAVFVLALLGAVLERTILRRALGQPHLTALLLTFGVGMCLRGLVGSVPAASQSLHRLPLPYAGETLTIGSLVVPQEHLVIMLATLVLTLCLSLFFRFSRFGIALRACSQDAGVAALLGISVPALHTLAWALGAAVAACAGLLLAPVSFIHVNMGFLALKAFPAAVLGGMTSLPGALLAGIFIGVSEALAGLTLPQGLREIVPYLLLLLALLLFPNGLCSRSPKQERWP